MSGSESFPSVVPESTPHDEVLVEESEAEILARADTEPEHTSATDSPSEENFPRVVTEKNEVQNSSQLETIWNGLKSSFAERVQSVRNYITENNLHTFDGLSEKAKQVAVGVYEGAYQTPGLNRIVAKGEIYARNSWIELFSNGVRRHIEKIDAINSDIHELENDITEKTQKHEQKLSLIDTYTHLAPEAMNLIAQMLRTEHQKDIDSLSNKISLKKTERKEQEKIAAAATEQLLSLENRRNEAAQRIRQQYETFLGPIRQKQEHLQQLIAGATEMLEKNSAELASLDEKLVGFQTLHDQLQSIATDESGSITEHLDQLTTGIKRTRAEISVLIDKKNAELGMYQAELERLKTLSEPYEAKHDYFLGIESSTSVESETRLYPTWNEHLQSWNSFIQTSGDSSFETLDVKEKIFAKKRLQMGGRVSQDQFIGNLKTFLKQQLFDERQIETAITAYQTSKSSS